MQTWKDATPQPMDDKVLAALQKSVAHGLPLEDADFWVSFRRALLLMVDAIEKRHGIPSVIEQYERRSRKS
jgi:type II secretory pathway component PulF